MEQVRATAEKIEGRKKGLLDQLESYFKTLPVTRIEASGIIKQLITELRKDAEIAQMQPEKRQKEIQKSEQNIKSLETLQQTFEQLNTVAQRLEDAFNKVYPQQLAECERYDKRALEHYEKIDTVYDDEKAQQFFDIVENSLENIQAIQNYLAGPFSQFLNQSWAKLQTQMPQVKKMIEELGAEGIQVRILTEKEKKEHLALLKKKEEERKLFEAQKRAEKEWQEMAWWKKIWYGTGYFFLKIWQYILSFFSWIGSLFTRSK
jgi:hypothetical protein